MRILTKTAFLVTLTLAGCVHAQGNLVVGLPAAGIASQQVYGFTIHPDEWTCTRATGFDGDCDTCINVSGTDAELSTGELLPSGDWHVKRRWFKPHATVWLCQPHIKRLAQWFK